MGIFKNIFGKEEESKPVKIQWNPIETMQDLDAAEAISKERTVVLFKHSTRCSISRFVLKQFENTFDFPNQDVELYFLDLIEFRSISNEIASRYNVVHQSPQLIVLKNGKSVFDASHESIDAVSIKQYI